MFFDRRNYSTSYRILQDSMKSESTFSVTLPRIETVAAPVAALLRNGQATAYFDLARYLVPAALHRPFVMFYSPLAL